MTVKLENGKLLFTNEGTSIYELKIGNSTDDMFLKIELIPSEYSKENKVEEEEILVDTLNETVIERLTKEGFKLISQNEVETIQNSDW